jgi:hypothetical protein
MGNKMVILVLVLALVSIPGIASSQEELPLEIEWNGETYVQTYGIIPEERMSEMHRVRAINEYEIFVSMDNEDEIYVYNGAGYVIFVSSRVLEESVDYGEPEMELSGDLGPFEEEYYASRLITSPTSFTSADSAAKRVLGYWGSADYLWYSGCTKRAVSDRLSGTMTHWYNIGHGNTDLLAFYDANMYAYEFDGLPGINGNRIVLNSCLTYNGELKSVITRDNPNFFMAGKINLPVGPSEEVSADFWYYYSIKGMNEIEALNAALSANPGTSGWFGLWT